MTRPISAQDFLIYFKAPSFDRAIEGINSDKEVILGQPDSWTSPSSWISWGLNKTLGDPTLANRNAGLAKRFQDLIQGQKLGEFSVADLTNCITHTKELNVKLLTGDAAADLEVQNAMNAALQTFEKAKDKRLGDVPPSVAERLWGSLAQKGSEFAKTDWRVQAALLLMGATAYSHPGEAVQLVGTLASHAIAGSLSLATTVAQVAVRNPGISFGAALSTYIGYKAPVSGSRKVVLATGAFFAGLGSYYAPSELWNSLSELAIGGLKVTAGAGLLAKKVLDLGPVASVPIGLTLLYAYHDPKWVTGAVASLIARFRVADLLGGAAYARSFVKNGLDRIDNIATTFSLPAITFVQVMASKAAQLVKPVTVSI